MTWTPHFRCRSETMRICILITLSLRHDTLLFYTFYTFVRVDLNWPLRKQKIYCSVYSTLVSNCTASCTGIYFLILFSENKKIKKPISLTRLNIKHGSTIFFHFIYCILHTPIYTHLGLLTINMTTTISTFYMNIAIAVHLMGGFPHCTKIESLNFIWNRD